MCWTEWRRLGGWGAPAVVGIQRLILAPQSESLCPVSSTAGPTLSPVLGLLRFIPPRNNHETSPNPKLALSRSPPGLLTSKSSLYYFVVISDPIGFFLIFFLPDCMREAAKGGNEVATNIPKSPSWPST